LAGPETADEFRARHFRRVEFELAAHAVENVARLVIGEELEIDAARLNLAGIEAQQAVIESAGKGQRQLGRRGGGLCHIHAALQAFNP
jgi:hypothetical protein